MKTLLHLLLLFSATAFAQLRMVPPIEAPLVFGGRTQTIEIGFKNESDKMSSADGRTRLYQASSATLMPVGEWKPWKKLQVLAGQTVIENCSVDLPSVRAATQFRLKVFGNEKQIADLEIRVVPNDLLRELSNLAGKTGFGIFDPDNQLKPLLRKQNVEFHDLENDAGFDNFNGKLAILGPFRSSDSVPQNFRKRILAAQRTKSVAIVWIQPPDAKSDPLLPIYLMRETGSTVAVVRSDVVADLKESPKAQLNLLRAAELALHPESLQLPENENP